MQTLHAKAKRAGGFLSTRLDNEYYRGYTDAIEFVLRELEKPATTRTTLNALCKKYLKAALTQMLEIKKEYAENEALADKLEKELNNGN